jgi:hypothetical protein
VNGLEQGDELEAELAPAERKQLDQKNMRIGAPIEPQERLPPARPPGFVDRPAFAV